MPLTSRTADYSQLVHDGHYRSAPSGLQGRHDLVRRHWEDQLTRFALTPYLHEVRQRVKAAGRGLRILDMGCGNGEGWDLLTRIPSTGTGRRWVLEPADVETYVGLDLCAEMVNQARARLPGLQFQQGDLSDSDSLLRDQPPFDLYFSGYGSLSHLTGAQLLRLLGAVACHAGGHALVVLDLLGQFSLEWPGYWGYTQGGGADMAAYNMLWIYPRREWPTRRADFSDYRLRFWGGAELQEAVLRTSPIASRIHGLRLHDRSIFVGRHMGTGEFNQQTWPVRDAVNSLWELNQVTAFETLRMGGLPSRLPAETGPWLRDFERVWNLVVRASSQLAQPSPDYACAQACLRDGRLPNSVARGLDSLIRFRADLDTRYPEIPLCDSLEPQVAVLLRQTEYYMQRGLGCGHGLLAILELS